MEDAELELASLSVRQNKALRADNTRLQAQNAQMRVVLEGTHPCLTCSRQCKLDDRCEAARCYDDALSADGSDYHNPADVKRIAELEKALTEAQREAARYAGYERQAVLQR
jgi:hypothetical protein